MKPFYLLLLFVFTLFVVSAQDKVQDIVITNSVVTNPTTQLAVKKYQPSGLIPVKAGEVLSILPNVTIPPKQHRLLVGIAKTLGIGALAYQANKTLQPVTGTKLGSSKGKPSVLPAIGLGVAVGLPSMIKGLKKQPQPFLRYSFYNNDKTLVTQQIRQLNSKQKPILQPVPSDGFVQVVLVGAVNAKAADLEIEINPKPYSNNSNQMLGSLATTMNLQTYGECLGGGDDGGGDNGDVCDENSASYDELACDSETCDPSSPNYEPDVCNGWNGDPCDPNTYDDARCDAETCNPSSPNYDAETCNDWNGDPCAVSTYDETRCDAETCNPSSPNYDAAICNGWEGDPCAEATYNDARCDAETCNPNSPNYEPTVCTNWNNPCDGLRDTYWNSFQNGSIKEQSGFLVKDAQGNTHYINNPDDGNTNSTTNPSNFHVYHDGVTGLSYIMIGSVKYTIIAFVHSHPNTLADPQHPNGWNFPPNTSDYDAIIGMLLGAGQYGIILGANGHVYQYFTDGTYTDLGDRDTWIDINC
jgi:hypothetical protein